MTTKGEFEARLLIIRGSVLVIVIWALAQLYVTSATGGNQSDQSLSSLLNEKTMRAKELQERLEVLVNLGDPSELYSTRDEWMLLLLKNNLKEKSLESAREQLADLKKDTDYPPEKKLPLYENIALVFRSTENFDEIPHIYRIAKKDLEKLAPEDRELYQIKLSNNEAVSKFFEGLSMEAPSIETLDNRIKVFEKAEAELEETGTTAARSQGIDPEKKAVFESILSKNQDEINQELVFARLRHSFYRKESRGQTP